MPSKSRLNYIPHPRPKSDIKPRSKSTGIRVKRVQVTVSNEQLQVIKDARGLEPQSAFISRAIDTYLEVLERVVRQREFVNSVLGDDKKLRDVVKRHLHDHTAKIKTVK